MADDTAPAGATLVKDGDLAPEREAEVELAAGPDPAFERDRLVERGPPIDEPRERAAAPPNKASGWLTPAAVYGGAALLTAVMYQAGKRSSAEAEHPPIGRFLKVDGTTLHYTDIGEGSPIVLLHGIGTTLEDWFISPLMDLLLPHHRVIAIDRPGHGYSDRPAHSRWTPERQARAIAHLLHRLGAHDAVVVAHSYGVLPAIALALQHEGFARALVLIAGVYYPGSTHAKAAATAPAVPILGPLARMTVAPSIARAALPAMIRASFEPQPVPRRFHEEYPAGLVTRTSQLDAGAEEGSRVDSTAERIGKHYPRIACPVTVVTGSGDGIFDPDEQSRRFAGDVPHARLIVVPASGHMVHHSGAARVAAAILETASGEVEEDDQGAPPDADAGLLSDEDAAAGSSNDQQSFDDADEDDGTDQGTTSGGRGRAASGASSASRSSAKRRSASKKG